MVFKALDHNIEEWLTLEVDNLLQKVCNVYDIDNRLTEQYKTRVEIYPVGAYGPTGQNDGKKSTVAPSLYRSFSYDDNGLQIASLPIMSEWTVTCEDAAQGDIPSNPPAIVISGGKTGKFNEGQFTDIDLVSTGWTELKRSGTTTPVGTEILANRNTVAIKNTLVGINVLINHVSTVGTVTGAIIEEGQERIYTVSNDVVLYARLSSGSGTIGFEELS